MARQLSSPIIGTAVRFAPRRDTIQPATSIWKVWAQGNEVYALSRSAQGINKISVHQSGAIHYRLGIKHKQDLAPLMQLGTGPWSHAFEIRFLLDGGALAPFKQREALKNKTAYLIHISEGNMLYGNLIIGKAGLPLDYPIPNEFFGGGQPFWKTRLSDGRIAVLVARILALDDQSREAARFVRDELGLKITFTAMPKDRYAEIHHLFWGPGGNVILVVPLAQRSFLSEEDIQRANDSPGPPRGFDYHSPHSTVDLVAPDGQRVACIEFPQMDRAIELTKGVPRIVDLGRITMRLERANLIEGSKFTAAPRKLTCIPQIGGASPRDWTYLIESKFDGSRLFANLHRISVGLQNKNLSAPVTNLEDSEEIVMAIPNTALILAATLDSPSTSSELLGHFTLRNQS